MRRTITGGRRFVKRFLFIWIFPAVLAGCGGSTEPGKLAPNIILFTLESLRADHVGCYGYARPVTPNLDRFAAEAVRFAEARSPTSWTLTAHASLMTGLYPAAHGVLEPTDRLADGFVTLAEALSEPAGDRPPYATAAFVSGPFLRAAFHLGQGFALYDDSAASPGEVASHGDVTNPAMERKIVSYLRSSPPEPFFLFGYFWDIHYDYIPPPPFDTLFAPPGAEKFDISRFEFNDGIRPGMSRERLTYVVSQYDGEIRCTDEMLGRILAVIREEGLWDDTIIIVTADHGEEFFEHGEKGHKHNLHVESLRVPLLVKPAGRFEPRVERAAVSLVDLFPTLAPGGRGASPGGAGGRALPGWRSSTDGREALVADLALPLRAVVNGEVVAKRTDRHLALRTGLHKLIRLPRREGVRLYSVDDDPAERRDLSAQRPDLCDSLDAVLTRRLAAMEESAAMTGDGGTAAISPEERARLEALGYMK